eukprot:gb/GEZN01008021.1/.p1 GENE.gb/GEZN01008021.1/~~gb/GEZN01008021.1/.p1  ORF type:complete len:471 (+),score=15.65 gb/GEZN01008021.1/:52-1464(+)
MHAVKASKHLLEGSRRAFQKRKDGTGTAHSRVKRPGAKQLESGTVYGWGSDVFGGLVKTYEPTIHRVPPLPIGAIHKEEMSSIYASFYTNLGITTNGSVWQWGWRPHLRSLTKAARSRPRWGWLFPKLQSSGLPAWITSGHARPPELLSPFGPEMRAKQVAAGGEFSIALTQEGEVYSWHTGFYGQLGHGPTVIDCNVNLPRRVEKDIQMNLLPRMTQIAAGFQHTLMLAEDGLVYSCGKGSTGSLGLATEKLPEVTRVKIGTNTSMHTGVNRPTCIQRTNEKFVLPEVMGRIKQISAGWNFSVFLDVDGDIWATGKNEFCQLGNQDCAYRQVPTRVDLKGIKIKQICAGANHVIAQTEQGEIYTWGLAKHGQCGRPKSDIFENLDLRRHNEFPLCLPGPVPLPNPQAIRTLSAGLYDSAAITAQGTVVLFGGDEQGQDGYSEPHVILPELQVKQIAFGFMHTLALAQPR